MNTPNIRLIVDLNDGTTLPGTFVCIAHDIPTPQCFDDTITHDIPQAVWTLTIRPTTLGKLDVVADGFVQPPIQDYPSVKGTLLCLPM